MLRMSCMKKKNYIFIKKCDIYKNKSIEAEINYEKGDEMNELYEENNSGDWCQWDLICAQTKYFLLSMATYS